MKKINFKEFKVFTDISKTQTTVGDARESFANILYTRFSGVRAKNLALKIFNAEGETELSPEDVELVKTAANCYCVPAFIDSIEEQLNN
ncbi:MAG: hypothetical protein LBN18_02180 [Dysgonamonadaceae bacterium]|jgi:hypothetical protein|nr:hypothetical protein [Dysgonamonadaceae bacterium]